MLLWTWIAFALLVAAVPSHSTPLHSKNDDVDYRLPDNVVVPTAYNLHITPTYSNILLNSTGFQGVVEIEANIKVDTKEIVLHMGSTIEIEKEAGEEAGEEEQDEKEKEILCVILVKDSKEMDTSQAPNATLCQDSSSTNDAETNELLELSSINLDTQTEKLSIHLKETIPKGSIVRIVIQYKGVFPEGALTGFYISSYKDSENTDVGMLTTKFEPTHARKAFPCFDEPALKATFRLHVTISGDIGVISNMEAEQRDPSEKKAYESFKETPVMSTYLLAFIIYEKSSFTYTDSILRPSIDVPYKTWGRKSMINDASAGELSQVEGPQALDILQRFTGINYTDTMTKMDMAAIPDFQSGAMENWGLVTYRETSLLFDRKTGTTTNHKRVVDVIDHELTHMWFGNLVTCSWWSHIWLNEGFARYAEYLIGADRYPNWHMEERIVLDEQMKVFDVDAQPGASPLTDTTVKSPQDIANHFGTITYSKGAAILRQIVNVMGMENFKKGIHDYLEARKSKAAEPSHLFENLGANLDVEYTQLTYEEFLEVLESWTTNAGYPVITVYRLEPTKFHIHPERFLLSPDEDSSTTYPVYLTWATSNNATLPDGPKRPQKWLTSMETIEIPEAEGSDWVLFNIYQGGYYRVNYDDEGWAALAQALDSAGGAEAISAVDRAGLVDNALALARAGYVTYATAFGLMRFLRRDALSFEPWAAARSALAHTQRMLGRNQAFKEYIAYLVEPAFNATGFEVRLDNHIERTHRVNVLSVACSVDYEPCISECQYQLMRHLHHNDAVEVDLKSIVFCYGLKGDSGSYWDGLWEKYQDATAAEQSTLISALGCIDHRDTLMKFLEKSINGEVRKQDAYTVFSSVYSNPDGVQVALDFLTFWGYKKLDQEYGAVRNAMASLLSGLASRLTTVQQKKQLEHVLQDNSEYESVIETVASNIEWLSKYDATILSSMNQLVNNQDLKSGQIKTVATSTLTVICAVVLVWVS